MRRLVVFDNVTLDGYFAAPDGDIGWAHRDAQDAEFDARRGAAARADRVAGVSQGQGAAGLRAEAVDEAHVPGPRAIGRALRIDVLIQGRAAGLQGPLGRHRNP